MPPAPVTFLTIILTPLGRYFPPKREMAREMVSKPPPGEKVTTLLMFFSGNSAWAAVPSSISAAKPIITTRSE